MDYMCIQSTAWIANAEETIRNEEDLTLVPLVELLNLFEATCTMQ